MAMDKDLVEESRREDTSEPQESPTREDAASPVASPENESPPPDTSGQEEGGQAESSTSEGPGESLAGAPQEEPGAAREELAEEALYRMDRSQMSVMARRFRPFVEEPERIAGLGLDELRELWRRVSEAQAFLDLRGGAMAGTPVEPVAREMGKVLQALAPRVRSELDRRYRSREWVISGVMILIHLLVTACLLAGQWIMLLPWYLVIGTLVLWLAAKVLDRNLVGGSDYRLGSLMPTPRGIVVLPLLSVLTLVLLFTVPASLGFRVRAIGVVTEPSPLTVSCTSSLAVGPPLQAGQEVLLEGEAQEECLRVSTYDGRVGFLPRTHVELRSGDTLLELEKLTLMLAGVVAVVIGLWLWGRRLYAQRIAPALLARKAARQQEVLRKRIEEAELLREFQVEGQILTNLDLQQAKDELVVKLVERFSEQSRKIVESPTLSPSEKDQMLARLTEWTMEALGRKAQN